MLKFRLWDCHRFLACDHQLLNTPQQQLLNTPHATTKLISWISCSSDGFRHSLHGISTESILCPSSIRSKKQGQDEKILSFYVDFRSNLCIWEGREIIVHADPLPSPSLHKPWSKLWISLHILPLQQCNIWNKQNLSLSYLLLLLS